MADINANRIFSGDGVAVFEWPNVSEADAFVELDLSGFPNPILEFGMNGTPGGMTTTVAGGYVAGEAHPTLNDPGGNAVEFAASGAFLCATSPLYVKPSRSGGSSASHDVRCVVRF